jgi:general stress protein CsbA
MQDTAQRWFLKLVKYVVMINVVLGLLAEALRHITAAEFYGTLALASITAYFVYTHRHPREKRQGQAAGERTPVLPRRDA